MKAERMTKKPQKTISNTEKYGGDWGALNKWNEVVGELAAVAPKQTVTVFKLPEASLPMIDDLIGSIYGKSRAEVVRTLVIDQLKRLVADKVIKMRH